jgi:hypothetical protein
MRQVTKEFHCHCCGLKDNITVLETVLKVICKNCGVYVTLGKALGFSGGDALLVALIIWGLFG